MEFLFKENPLTVNIGGFFANANDLQHCLYFLRDKHFTVTSLRSDKTEIFSTPAYAMQSCYLNKMPD